MKKVEAESRPPAVLAGRVMPADATLIQKEWTPVASAEPVIQVSYIQLKREFLSWNPLRAVNFVHCKRQTGLLRYESRKV